MSECRGCGVKVPYNSNCPLCGKYLRDGARAERFPTSNTGRKISAKKVFRFIFIVSGFICLFLDAFLTWFRGWSIITCMALIFAWFLAVKPVFDRKPFALFVLYGVLLVCAFTLVIDFQHGYEGWSASYAMPGAAAAGITLILFSSLIRKVKWSEVGVYVLTLTLLNTLFLILGLFDVIPYIGVSLIVGAYSLICLFGMKYFLDKAFNEELRRKLHM